MLDFIFVNPLRLLAFTDNSVVNNLPANSGDTGDTGLIPGLRRYPEGGNDNPFFYFCQEDQMDRGVWQAIVHGVTRELDTT